MLYRYDIHVMSCIHAHIPNNAIMFLTLSFISVLDSPVWVSMFVREEEGVRHIVVFIHILDSLHSAPTLLLCLQMYHTSSKNWTLLII